MPLAQTQTEASHVLVNLVLVDRGHLVQVSRYLETFLFNLYLIFSSFSNFYAMIYLKMLTSVLLEPITVTQMPPAPTQTGALRVLATVVSPVMESVVQVTEDFLFSYLYFFLSYFPTFLSFKVYFSFLISRI